MSKESKTEIVKDNKETNLKLYEKILFLCNETKIPFSKFCADFLLSEETIKNHKIKFSDITIENIAKYFNVTTNFLLNKNCECYNCKKVIGEVNILYKYENKYLCFNCLVDTLQDRKISCDNCGCSTNCNDLGEVIDELYNYNGKILCLDCIQKEIERIKSSYFIEV